MSDKLNRLKHSYEQQSIPTELDDLITKGLERGIRARKRRRRFMVSTSMTAAALLFLTITVNTNIAFAKTLENVPILGAFVQLITVNDYVEDTDTLKLDVSVPKIVGMEDKQYEAQLNEELKAEANKIMEEATAKSVELAKKKAEQNNVDAMPIMIDSRYELLSVTDILSFKVVTTEIQASAYEQETYYNIDLRTNKQLQLQDIFVEKVDYRSILNKEITRQIKDQMKKDENALYFEGEDGFTSIKGNQSFYINKEGELVIVFGEYEIAPGAMGTPSFVIPKEVTKDIMKL
ncbi:MAG: DUF3298 domain-containing protein [Bacillaceae bacterium]